MGLQDSSNVTHCVRVGGIADIAPNGESTSTVYLSSGQQIAVDKSALSVMHDLHDLGLITWPGI